MRFQGCRPKLTCLPCFTIQSEQKGPVVSRTQQTSPGSIILRKPPRVGCLRWTPDAHMTCRAGVVHTLAGLLSWTVGRETKCSIFLLLSILFLPPIKHHVRGVRDGQIPKFGRFKSWKTISLKSHIWLSHIIWVRLVVYSIIYRLWYILGGVLAGFLNHQQYLTFIWKFWRIFFVPFPSGGNSCWLVQEGSLSQVLVCSHQVNTAATKEFNLGRSAKRNPIFCLVHFIPFLESRLLQTQLNSNIGHWIDHHGPPPPDVCAFAIPPSWRVVGWEKCGRSRWKKKRHSGHESYKHFMIRPRKSNISHSKHLFLDFLLGAGINEVTCNVFFVGKFIKKRFPMRACESHVVGKKKCKPNPFPKTTLFVEVESRFDGTSINKPIKMNHVRKNPVWNAFKKKTKKTHTKNPPVHSIFPTPAITQSIAKNGGTNIKYLYTQQWWMFKSVTPDTPEKMMVFNSNLLFQGSPIFRFHVCFGWCTLQNMTSWIFDSKNCPRHCRPSLKMRSFTSLSNKSYLLQAMWGVFPGVVFEGRGDASQLPTRQSDLDKS